MTDITLKISDARLAAFHKQRQPFPCCTSSLRWPSPGAAPSLAVRGMVRSLRSQGVAVEIATTDDDGPGLRFNTAYGSQLDFEGLPVAFFPKSSPDRREFLYCPR